jgi:flagellin FlaB
MVRKNRTSGALLHRLLRQQHGITGLETAILLIAFVVVASVFAYTVLSAGIFSSQKGSEAIHAGLEASRSSMVIVGGLTAKDTDGDGDVDQFIFTVANALDGVAIDLTATTDSDSDGLLSDESNASHQVVINYSDKNQRISDIAWTRKQVGNSDGDNLLEGGEKFEITVDLKALSTALGASQRFSLEVNPPRGSSLVIERTTPARIEKAMYLN